MQQRSASLSIKNWSDADKPREKLRLKGRKVLTNAELIAILIGSGTKHESAVELSRRILHSYGDDLNELGKLSVNQLMEFNGIGEAKAIKILAAIEIGHRRRFKASIASEPIKSSQTVFELLHPQIGDLEHEEFWIVYMNNSNRVLRCEQLSKGGITGTLVDVRLVMKKALELGSVSLILAHNHPSGTLSPSQSDKELTQKLIKAANSLDIKVLDHLIITKESYFSFADNMLI